MAEETPEVTAFNAADLTTDDLTAEYGRIRSRGAELAAKSDLTADETAELAELASRVTSVTSELDTRDAQTAALNEQRDAFATLPERTPVAPVVPQAAQTAVVEPTSVQTSTETVPVPSVAEMAVQPVVPHPAQAARSTITAFVSSDAAGHIGKSSGSQYEGIDEISEALVRSTQQYGRTGGGKGARHAIAQFKRTRDERLVVNDPRDGASVLRYARDEKRLASGSLARTWQELLDQGAASLTAAAGWCAPSENDYDLCRQWSAGVGLLDLPEITVSRGGVNYTNDVNFQAMYVAALAAGITFLTEAEVIADTPKTCIELPCPEFEDRRLDVQALCIRVSFLQAAGYPEVVSTWTDGLLAINEYEMNRRVIAQIIARAGAATVIPATVPGDSYTAGILSAVELAATDIRAQFVMDPQSTVEIVLPWWVLGAMRADLSRRTGVDMLSIADADIARMFSVRNVRVQFVRGWQDGLITGGALDPTFPGGDITAPYALVDWPTEVSFLAYPAGSVVLARQDVVTLTNVYDSSSLTQNLFTSLFAEEGFATLFPCEGQRLYTVEGLCDMGPTGAAELTCTVEAP